ncbi:MAG: tyrosine-type recombinase/integrase [Clostridium fessum]
MSDRKTESLPCKDQAARFGDDDASAWYGLRVSECVGLNINDVDFRNGGLRIHRKGGKEVIVYFGAEVEYALQDYLSEREHIVPEEGARSTLPLHAP